MIIIGPKATQLQKCVWRGDFFLCAECHGERELERGGEDCGRGAKRKGGGRQPGPSEDASVVQCLLPGFPCSRVRPGPGVCLLGRIRPGSTDGKEDEEQREGRRRRGVAAAAASSTSMHVLPVWS